jgi:hypothetical protein
VKFHEQMLIQINEGEFPEEEQEDESLLENNLLRRLYRILTLPTPDMVAPKRSAATTELGTEFFDDEQDPAGSIVKSPSAVEGQQSAVAPVVVEEVNVKSGLVSVLFKSMYLKSQRIKDCLLSITNKCQECNISNFCENQDDFKVLLQNLSSASLELIQDSFQSTPFTRKIVNTKWYSESAIVTFRQNTSVITEENCE